MGGAAPVIGLATQALGAIGGGGGGTRTVYQPDPRAKYEVDMAMFQRAEENKRLAEDVLRGQIDTQKGFAKYQYDLQAKLIDQEAWEAQANLESQFQMGLFNQSIQRLVQETQRYQQLTQFQMQRDQVNFENEQAMNRLGLRADEIELSERGIETDRAGAEAGYNLAQSGTTNQRNELALQAQADKQALSWANKDLDLRDAGLMDARTGVNYQEQGLDLAQIQSNATYSQELQALGTNKAENSIQAQMAKANADQIRREALRSLSTQIAADETAASQIYAQLTGQGFRMSPQVQAIQAQMIGSDANKNERASIMDRYTSQLGMADLQQSMGDARVDQQGRALNQNKRLSDANIDLQRGGLDLSRSDISRQQTSSDYARDQAGQQFTNAQSMREIQANQLAAQEEYDLLSKSLIPNEQFDMAQSRLDIGREQAILDSQAANYGMVQGNMGVDLAQQGFGVEQGIQDEEMALRDSAMLPMFESGLGQLIEQRTMNDASNWARYQQQLGQASLAQSAGLNQIGAQTHGVLSNLGGYENPPPVQGGSSGGGFNAGALGGLAKGLMSMFAGGGGGGSSYSGGGGDLLGHSSPSPAGYSGHKMAPVGTSTYNNYIPAPYIGRK